MKISRAYMVFLVINFLVIFPLSLANVISLGMQVILSIILLIVYVFGGLDWANKNEKPDPDFDFDDES